MEQLTTTDFPARQASMSDPFKSSSSLEPSQSSSYLGGASNLVDEPSNSLLSPLLLTTPKSSSRGIGRHSTFPLVNGPSSLDAIPESSSSDQHQYSSLSRKSRNPARGKTEPIEAYHHSQHSPTNHSMSNGASPYYNTPSRSSQSPGSSRTSSQHTSPTALTPQSTHDHHSTPPTSGGSRHSNPLPQPPLEHYNGSQKRRVRKGYWNKRGDHLTMSGFIVYAPNDQANPPELHDYPEASVAYRDEKGQVVNFLQRPEHPDSRPRHGQPPIRPYSSFIEYV
ncbi:hypothetical protein M378DRAFT_179753 [Amanita muscaria Koide BX008]|uniref:Uncharacterized protein n=1 Tax=Amanita muscaria (strain Koide BX008) TaxID=946122 RepID=A0A0C2T6L1_AMAMK|nr:hypothetical protein M378DRAFT_179753 [Amanita muscaria Koide BX008]